MADTRRAPSHVRPRGCHALERPAPDPAGRRTQLWLLAAAAVAVAAPATLGSGLHGPSRTAVGVLLLAAPGVCVAALARLDDPLLTVAVGAAAAMCVNVAVALSLLYLQQWGTVRLTLVTSAVTLALAVPALLRGGAR